jgi:aryl-alcohol dehydrogenase-like predicted oxidoreductase
VSRAGPVVKMRGLGPGGLISSAIGLGTAPFAGLYGTMSTNDCRRVVEVALDCGITMMDTADFYAGGAIERLLGRSVASRRDGVLISTHGGVRAASDGSPTVIDGHPAYLAMACDASLRRLGTDYVDLYYLSRVDPRVSVEDSIGKLADLVTAGKIRYLGLCEASAEDLRRAHAVHPISALAVEYSLRNRSAERRILSTAMELNVGVVAYCPLARGLLAGARPATSAPERSALRAVEAEAAELDIGMARLALAWLVRCRNVIPVPSSRNPAHLEMNASAAGIELTPAACSRLNGLFPA